MMAMGALRQYIDLFRDHRDLIDSNSAPLINALRPAALEALGGGALPALGSEDYTVTDLEAILAPDFGLNLAKVPVDVDPRQAFHCGVPRVSTCMGFMLNDTFVGPSDRQELPDGVLFMSLRKAAEEHPELIAPYYGKLADLQNPVVALNTLLAQDGLLLYVPDGVKVEKPLQMVDVMDFGMPLMAVRRMLVVLGRGAEARLLVCDHTQRADLDFLSLQTVEIFAGEDSLFDLYDLEESTLLTSRLSALYLEQQRGSKVLLDGITLYNGRTRNEYYCRFAGRDAELNLLGMGIEDGRRVLDTHSVVRHEVGGCHTDELFKYVVDDEARGSFAGRVYVAPGASGTTAYQANRNIVGGDKARMYSKPQLEIYNDDVKCSHGTAIGQLDPMQLFYMRTRGIAEAEAKLLLKQAFMADVIDRVSLPGLKERLHALVERRFNGCDASCASCRDASSRNPEN